MIKTYIERPLYIDKIRPFIGKDMIKVIMGQRRVGKSVLLRQIMDILKTEMKPAPAIIYINKELYEFEFIKDEHDLLSYVAKQANKKKQVALFIDEIQDIANFEKALRSLQSSGRYDIYCTGSNAHLLSGELATYLSGRHIAFEVYSLSYSEFLLFHNFSESKESFEKYIRYGGLPYLKNLSLDDNVVYDYLQNVYNTIIFKDVVTRYHIRNVSFLNRLIEYLSDNVGSLVSAYKISDFLKSQRTKISPNVVLNYLSFLTSAFLIFPVSRFQIVGKKILEINEKYYFEDLGLRHSIIGFRAMDIHKILENLVGLHLKLNGYTITVGILGAKEVDFAATRHGETLYIQVVYLLNNENVQKREFGNLLAIPDNYRKIVVSMDEMVAGTYQGIEHMHIRQFLTAVL